MINMPLNTDVNSVFEMWGGGQDSIVSSMNINGVLGFGGVFDTSPETARHLIELGRKDARKVLAEAGLIKSVGGGRQ